MQVRGRSTVFDSCHWLRVDLNAYSALLDLDENEGSTESTQCTALATGAEKKASELALIFRGWRGVIRSQAAAKRKLGLRSAAMTRAMREAWHRMAEHSLCHCVDRGPTGQGAQSPGKQLDRNSKKH